MRLGRHFKWQQDKDLEKQAIGVYERYLQLEPHDPSAQSELAEVYEKTGGVVKADAVTAK